jgi:hypothetical protein
MNNQEMLALPAIVPCVRTELYWLIGKTIKNNARNSRALFSERSPLFIFITVHLRRMNYSCAVYELQLRNIHERQVFNSCNQGAISSTDLL